MPEPRMQLDPEELAQFQARLEEIVAYRLQKLDSILERIKQRRVAELRGELNAVNKTNA